jgi:molybdenum cofactor cytidylyltransferase
VITGIVLAAGMSTRLGRPKQLLELRGKPLLQHALDAARASELDEVVLVLGYLAADIARRIDLGHRGLVAVNPDYAAGQSTSLRTGLRSADPSSEAAVILLGDQPGVLPEVVDAVIQAWRTESNGPVIVQAAYGGRAGHPILFARSLWPEMESAAGDEGARTVVESHREKRLLVEVGGGPPPDIDTEEDYERLRAAHHSPPDKP